MFNIFCPTFGAKWIKAINRVNFEILFFNTMTLKFET